MSSHFVSVRRTMFRSTDHSQGMKVVVSSEGMVLGARASGTSPQYGYLLIGETDHSTTGSVMYYFAKRQGNVIGQLFEP
jgi:hypothetical protein